MYLRIKQQTVDPHMKIKHTPVDAHISYEYYKQLLPLTQPKLHGMHSADPTVTYVKASAATSGLLRLKLIKLTHENCGNL